MSDTRRTFFGKLAAFLGASALLGKEALKADEPAKLITFGSTVGPDHWHAMIQDDVVSDAQLIHRTPSTSTYWGHYKDGSQWVATTKDDVLIMWDAHKGKYLPIETIIGVPEVYKVREHGQ